VLLAEDGQAGLELYATRHGEIDAVLLDLTMPKIDGIEALGQMLAIDPAARILLMSGFDENTETARYGNLGQKGFLQKPFTIQSLLDKIHRALD
jgi:DNA-binding response OmpR family regulator